MKLLATTILLLFISCNKKQEGHIGKENNFKSLSYEKNDSTNFQVNLFDSIISKDSTSTKKTNSNSDTTGIKILSYLPKPHSEKGDIDYTRYLQKAINENKVIVMPNFQILINSNGLNIPSNRIIIFQKKSSLKVIPNDKEKYQALLLKNVDNVKIVNPRLIGDRNDHKGNKGEWGMGINILSSRNIQITNPIIAKFWGDGIYIGEIFHKERSKLILKDYSNNKIKIQGGEIDNNRRNGISVISAKNLFLENIVIRNSNGTMPMAGICLEPNNNEQFLQDVHINNIITKNNGEVGIKYVVSNYLGKREKDVSIYISNYKDYSSKVGLYIGGARNNQKYSSAKINGEIVINNLTLNDNEEPIRYGSNQNLSPKIKITSLKIFHNKKRMEKTEILLNSTLQKMGFKVNN